MRSWNMAKLWVLLAILISSVAVAQVTSADDGLASSHALFKQGDFRGAAASYQKAIERKPSPEAYAGLVQSLLKLDEVAEAEQSAEKVVRAFPQSAAAVAALGDVKFREGLMAEAEDQYTAAIKTDEKCARAWLGMGRIYSAASQGKRSRDAFSRAHELAPDDGDALYHWSLNQPY